MRRRCRWRHQRPARRQKTVRKDARDPFCFKHISQASVLSGAFMKSVGSSCCRSSFCSFWKNVLALILWGGQIACIVFLSIPLLLTVNLLEKGKKRFCYSRIQNEKQNGTHTLRHASQDPSDFGVLTPTYSNTSLPAASSSICLSGSIINVICKEVKAVLWWALSRFLNRSWCRSYFTCCHCAAYLAGGVNM